MRFLLVISFFGVVPCSGAGLDPAQSREAAEFLRAYSDAPEQWGRDLETYLRDFPGPGSPTVPSEMREVVSYLESRGIPRDVLQANIRSSTPSFVRVRLARLVSRADLGDFLSGRLETNRRLSRGFSIFYIQGFDAARIFSDFPDWWNLCQDEMNFNALARQLEREVESTGASIPTDRMREILSSNIAEIRERGELKGKKLAQEHVDWRRRPVESRPPDLPLTLAVPIPGLQRVLGAALSNADLAVVRQTVEAFWALARHTPLETEAVTALLAYSGELTADPIHGPMIHELLASALALRARALLARRGESAVRDCLEMFVVLGEEIRN